MKKKQRTQKPTPIKKKRVKGKRQTVPPLALE